MPLARAGFFTLAYFAAAEFGHFLTSKAEDQSIATFWPPAGIFVATFVLTARRSSWPLIVAAACGASLASDVFMHGKSVLVSLGFCLANSAEACIGAWLLRRFVGLPLTLARMKDVLGLAFYAAVISPIFGATIGAAVTMATPTSSTFWSVWRTWWTADALGIMIVAPAVLAWLAERAEPFRAVPTWRIVECVALFLSMFLVGEAVYGEFLPPTLRVPALILPFLLWAGLRLGPPGAAAAVVMVALIGVWNTSQGRGPFAALSAVPSEQVFRSQGTLAVISLSVLLLAAAVAERKQAEREKSALIVNLQQAFAEIKTLRGLIPICAWCKKIRGDKDYWHSVEEYITDKTEARFSHGVCPDCSAKMLSEVTRRRNV